MRNIIISVISFVCLFAVVLNARPQRLNNLNRKEIIKKALEKFEHQINPDDYYAAIERSKTSLYVYFIMSVKFVPMNSEYQYDPWIDLYDKWDTSGTTVLKGIEKKESSGIKSKIWNLFKKKKKDKEKQVPQGGFFKHTDETKKHVTFVVNAMDEDCGGLSKFRDYIKRIPYDVVIYDDVDIYHVDICYPYNPKVMGFYEVDKKTAKCRQVGHTF